MSPDTRAAIAAIVLAHSAGRPVSSIYEYDQGSARNIQTKVSGDQVKAYDYKAGCHVSGRLSSVYHYGNSAHIQIKAKGASKYGGFDYASGSHFEATVRGRNVSLYDYGVGTYFNYSG